MNILLRKIIVEIFNKEKSVFVIKNEQSVGARIDFNVDRLPNSNGGLANTAQIKVYNLSEETFEILSKGGYYISLNCGYNDVSNLIFYGKIKNVLRSKQGSDIVTTLYCYTSMGDDAYIAEAYVNIKLIDLLTQLADKIKVKKLIVNLDKSLANMKVSSYTIMSNAKEALNLLGLKYNFIWYYDNNILNIEAANYKKINFKINQNTGLIKPPVRTEAGVDIEMFLNPFVNPNDRFELSSKFSDYNLAGVEYVQRIQSGGFSDKREVDTSNYIGVYSILRLVHEGSSHTNTWYTKIVAHRV